MANVHLCAKADCKVAITGVCAEGHSPVESCPYYGSQDIADDETSENVESSGPAGAGKSDVVQLPAGDVLTPEDVDLFLLRRPITLVALVGDRDSGKTTLLASIYDRFLKGPFADYCFAGSRTLVGLEKKSHHSRVDSGRTKPDTERTRISEGLRFVHLGLRRKIDVSERIDLMISDRAGETYRRSRGQSKLIAELVEIGKADRVVLLLDGGRIAQHAERAGALHSVRQSIRAFRDGGILRSSAVVQVVTTKVDLLLDPPEKETIDQQTAQFRSHLEADFSSDFAELSFWETAARDPLGRLSPAHGVEALIRDWAARRPPKVPPARVPVHLESELDRLLRRTPIEVLP